MNDSPNAAGYVPPENYHLASSFSEITDDGGGLISTLDDYEVEELDWHDFARFLPEHALDEDNQEDL